MSSPIITKVNKEDASEIMDLLRACSKNMEKNGIFQWNEEHYPTLDIIKNDINNETLYKLNSDNKILAVITIDEEQHPFYEKVKWQGNGEKVLVVHRLAVHPDFQNKGYAKMLMRFVEGYAFKNGYTSIRLDVYSKNKIALEFYRKNHYKSNGKVYFPFREFSFYCFEKEI